MSDGTVPGGMGGIAGSSGSPGAPGVPAGPHRGWTVALVGAADSAAPRPSLGLLAGERAVWSGRARARWAWPLAVVLLLAGGALIAAVAARWGLAVPLLAAGFLTLGFTSVRVTVAARGVTVAYGPLGLRLTRIPLARIASATAEERTPLSFGYRGSLLVFGAAALLNDLIAGAGSCTSGP
jgi:hypothetical protein